MAPDVKVAVELEILAWLEWGSGGFWRLYRRSSCVFKFGAFAHLRSTAGVASVG